MGTLAEIWSGPVVLKTWVELLGLCDDFLQFVREDLRSIGRRWRERHTWIVPFSSK